MAKTLTKADISEQAKALARTMKVLGNYRRMMLYRWLAFHAAPIRFKALGAQCGIPASSLSRIVRKMGHAGLLIRTIGHDRSLTIEIDKVALRWVAGFLLRMHTAVERGATTASTTATTAAP